MKNVDTTDLIDYGLIPEFIGRIPVIAVLQQLTEDELVETLTKPENALIKEYQAIIKAYNVCAVDPGARAEGRYRCVRIGIYR